MNAYNFEKQCFSGKIVIKDKSKQDLHCFHHSCAFTKVYLFHCFFQPQDNPNSPKTNNVTSEPKKNDLRIEMPSPTTNSDHSPVTMTTSISRRPAEDSALDYAYDNPAMTKGSR